MDALDKENMNLYVGKTLTDQTLKCEVVEVHNNNIHVKILEIYWDRMGTYLDVGKIYPVDLHVNSSENWKVWEIDPKYMKRSTSQVLLCWEKEIGWIWDLDF